MKPSGLAYALVLVVMVNIFVLAGVYSNRSGILDASIELTERELPLAWVRHADENTGVAFKLNWNQLQQDWDWLDEKKLAQLGIDIKDLKTAQSNVDRHRPLPVVAYAVLEYAGPAWEKFRDDRIRQRSDLDDQVAGNKLSREEAERRRQGIHRELNLASRLFIVDVGADPVELRRKHPDRNRYMILPAEIRAAGFWSPPGTDRQNPEIRGQVDRILTDNIHVASEFQATLDGLPEKGRIHPNAIYMNTSEVDGPRYRVRLNNGARYEPWVVSVDEFQNPPVSPQ